MEKKSFWRDKWEGVPSRHILQSKPYTEQEGRERLEDRKESNS